MIKENLVKANDYTYYCYGNCSYASNVIPNGGFMLKGGGTDVDSAFKQFIQLAGGGDILILRASGSNGYDQYLYDLETCNSVSTIVFHAKTASSDPFVLGKIEQSSGIFFAGGDQSVYLNYWKNTPVETLLRKGITNNKPVGGTSAGMAILSQFIFSADNGGVTSKEALDNPYNKYMTFSSDFLIEKYLSQMICDQHFFQRDRMGRLLAFMARMMKDNGLREFRGIASDEATCMILINDVGTIFSHYPTDKTGNHFYFLSAVNPPTVCENNKPLTFSNITVYRLSNQELFDLKDWRPYNQMNKPYTLNVSAGKITSTQQGGSIY